MSLRHVDLHVAASSREYTCTRVHVHDLMGIQEVIIYRVGRDISSASRHSTSNEKVSLTCFRIDTLPMRPIIAAAVRSEALRWRL